MEPLDLKSLAIVVAFACVAAWFAVKAVWAFLRGVPAKFSYSDYVLSALCGIAVSIVWFISERNGGGAGEADPALHSSAALSGADPAFTAAAGASGIAVTTVNAAHLGFDMIDVTVDIENYTVFPVRNPLIRCDHRAGNGTVITTSEYQVYQDIAPGETARANFTAASSSQVQEVVCGAR